MSNLKELISAQNMPKKIYQIALKIYIYIFVEFQSTIHAISKIVNNYHHLTFNDISTKVKSIKYKILVPALRIKNVKQRFLYLKFTSRRRVSKTIFLKTRHSMLMLKHHQTEIDPNTEQTCDHCKVVETPLITSSTASSTK